MFRVRGFTLVEVMVALVVVAVALPALLISLYQQVDSTGYLRDKSLAHMVAANQLSQARILSEATGSLIKGKDSGETRMADRQWYWWLDSQPTEVAEFYRVEVSVAATTEQREQPLYTLVAFLSADLQSEPESESQPEPGPESEPKSESDVGDAGN